MGDRVTETFRTGQGQYSSVADPRGYQGLTGSKGTFMGSPAAPAFPEVPTRGLRTIGQRQLARAAWTPGEVPAGSRWPQRRGPEPATGPASGVTYKHRTVATLRRRASRVCPAPRPHQPLSGCLAQSWWGMGQKQAYMGCEGYPGTPAQVQMQTEPGAEEGPFLTRWGFISIKWEGSQQGKDKPMESKMY